MANVVTRLKRLSGPMCVVALALAGCGGGPERQCQFNSNCAAGRYCTPDGMCVADCTPEGGECGAAADCNSFGMCVPRADAGAVPDAFSVGVDAFVVRPDVGVDAFAERDAGPPPESCTESVAGSTATDEDEDGAIDEDCPWFFGTPEPMAEIGTYGSFLSADGLTLYITQGWDGTRTMTMRRPDRASPFGPATTLAITHPDIVWTAEISLLPDELTGFVQAATSDPMRGIEIFAVSRTTTSDGFVATPVPELASPAEDLHPAIRRDGLELFFGRGGNVMRATRTTPTGTLSVPAVVPGLEGHGYLISLSDDARDLFSTRDVPGGQRIYRAHRDSLEGAFATPVEVSALTPLGTERSLAANVSLATRELFYVSTTDAYRSFPAGGMFRVEICRDGPCESPRIDCPTEGIVSPDGTHCYFQSAATMQVAYMTADLACLSRGAHLPTIQSVGERDLLLLRFGSLHAFWLAGQDVAAEGTWEWVLPAGLYEPWNAYSGFPWGPSQPDNCACFGGELPVGAPEREDCSELDDGTGSHGYTVPSGGVNDVACGQSRWTVCEVEAWRSL